MWKKIVLGIVTGVFVLSVSAGSIYAYQKSSTGSDQENAGNIFSIFEKIKENKNFTADETGYGGAGGFGKGSLKECNFCQCPDGDEEECGGNCAQNSCNNQGRNCYMYKKSSSSNCGNPDACGQQKQAINQERNCYSIMNRENYNQQEFKNINGDAEGCGFNASQGQKGKNK